MGYSKIAVDLRTSIILRMYSHKISVHSNDSRVKNGAGVCLTIRVRGIQLADDVNAELKEPAILKIDVS
jgi:hypothetical protein